MASQLTQQYFTADQGQIQQLLRSYSASRDASRSTAKRLVFYSASRSSWILIFPKRNGYAIEVHYGDCPCTAGID